MFNINGYPLDESQINAIKCNSKATLVSAGAGSGKTLTIMGKIKYLIEELKVKEEEILCISFTNETVKSLHKKLLDIGYNIEVYTFHKLSLKLLNNEYKIANDNILDYIIDEYFKSYIKYNKNNFKKLKRLLYTDKDNLFKTCEYDKLMSTISTFIRLAKSNDYDEIDIYKMYKRSLFNERILLKMILEIFIIYKRELESIKAIDFDDMIHLAKYQVKDSNLNYKYIIIDEFQDTSLVRFNLIDTIVKHCDAKIFVVGDDWQSIYRFSGCNLDLFINFKKMYDDCEYFSLEYTYRNSSELIYVTSQFIMKNKRQLKKNIKSVKNLDKPIIILFNYSVDELIKEIDDEEIMVLGRNNKDINDINWNNKLTIHRSKGLECKNVILVNSDNIPSRIKNERILRFVLKERDYLMYEEERRLFYVALTRTKSYVYIIVNNNMSPFVKELIHDYKKYIRIIKKH